MSKRLSKNYSTTTKVLSLIAVVGLFSGLVIGGSAYVSRKNNKSVVATTTEVAAVSSNEPVQKAVLGAQTTSADYVVTVTSLTPQNGVLAVGLRISNSSQVTLQTSPFLQFSIVNTKTGEVRQPFLPANTTLYAGGPLVPNTSNQGVLYFNSFGTNDQYELRFLTDVTSTDYIVVPLIVAAN